jgi:hypothetical protein
MKAIAAVGILAAMAGAARAEPPSEEVAIAAATRFETGPRLCKAMARASHERRDCTRATLPPRLRWHTRVRGDARIVTTEVGQESFWIVTLVVDARGRAIAESSLFSYGGP